METLKQPLYSHAGGTIIHTGDREQGSRSLGLDGSPARLNRAGRSGLGCRGDRAEHPANRCTGRSDSHRRVAGAGPLSVGCSCGTVPPRFARCLRSGRGRCRPQWTAATGADGHPSPSVPPAVLKPIADRIRRTPPFGSPKPEGQQDQARQNTGGNRRRQDNPPRGGTDARVHRRGRWQAQSALHLRGYVDGPASLACITLLASLPEARLNGFHEARAVAPRHRIAGRRRRVSDTSAPGLSDATMGDKPAYPAH